jgi:cytochrome c oxidase subunit 2
MTATHDPASVPPPLEQVQQVEQVDTRRAWRRAPIFPILLIWGVLTILLVIFGLTVPARLMGVAASPTMREVKSTMTAFTVASAPVAALVWAILLYSVFAWRHRGSEPPPDDAPPMRGHPRVQAIWLIVSTALCLFLLVWGLVLLQPPSSEANATTPPLVVNVTGNQWVWTFDYPDSPGVETDTLYLPVDQRVLFRVTSKDVIHSFWIVEMAVKVDANPGETTVATVTPDRLGTFTIKCAELCGLYHSHMQTTVHVVTQEEFDSWLRTTTSTA